MLKVTKNKYENTCSQACYAVRLVYINLKVKKKDLIRYEN